MTAYKRLRSGLRCVKKMSFVVFSGKTNKHQQINVTEKQSYFSFFFEK